MPLDHYIPQVHLRRFYSPDLGDRMYAILKKDPKSFTPNSRAVCAINAGSTNAYLREDRAIEEFLKAIEPNYNAAVDNMLDGKIDDRCIFAIAGFTASVIICSPAGMRINSAPLKSIVETTAAKLDAQGALPRPPPEVAGTSLTELLRSGKVKVTIDPKFPQAVGISSILERTAVLGNFKWEALYNGYISSPFFTSDFPAAIEETNGARTLNRIVPLAPNLALRIIPDPTLDRSKVDFSFANFSCRRSNIKRHEAVNLNRLIVQCAEEMIFYRDSYPWVLPFIAKNRHYRIEPRTSEHAAPRGAPLHSTQRIVETIPSAESTKASGT